MRSFRAWVSLWLGRIFYDWEGADRALSKPWKVDREGVIRTDKDRPVVLQGNSQTKK